MNALYSDSVIEVKLLTDEDNTSIRHIALRYVKPCNYTDKNGAEVVTTNVMGGETDWFILPHTFGAAIGKKLFEQYHAGLDGFNKSGVEELKNWLADMGLIDDAMCY